MKNTLVYTFRTFPFIQNLKDLGVEVIILGKLKQDLKVLEEKILSDQYDFVLGIAISNSKSKIETQAVNKFNKGLVLKDGKEKYLLHIPQKSHIKINNGYTTSFCNYAMYNVSKIIDENNLLIKHSFIHINEKDISKLPEAIPS